MLPKSIDRPIFYDGAALDALQDPALVATIKQTKARLGQQYTKIATILKASADEPFNTKRMFFWAMSMVSSRALSIHGERFLVPFADMFNGMPHEVE